MKQGNTFVKYGFIGIFNTILGYGLTFYLFYVGVFAELANFLGYFLGFFVSYFLNKKYNFKSDNSHKKDLPRFLLSMGIAYILNLITFLICYRYFAVDVYFSQILAGIIYILSGYTLSKIWAFRAD